MDDVWGIVSNLEAKGAAPSLMAGMLLLETAIELALRGRADLKDGAKIEEWVRSWGGVPDTAFYARLLDLGAKAPNVTPSDGFALLEKMKRLGVAPNVVTYTSLMDLLAKRGASLSEGESVLADMEEEGVRPTNKTYTALLCIIQVCSCFPPVFHSFLPPCFLSCDADFVVGERRALFSTSLEPSLGFRV